ncbi:ubiquinol-cytochrome c reductase complex core protein [Niveomyces insectorum RCEF 264]|uniref:Cytochrome b-c1 complex subunit 2, mitochondrial n=1 Tax=Niveomyces insectorum RCEF 264 TaxID=1081102 RepID=A0A167ZSW2_9HYPO|nr:ubiquinol-cytochrome c reductase complex core protein [Niveomyces insectorum RCEF 264]
MLSRSAVSRASQLALRRQAAHRPATRGYAAAAAAVSTSSSASSSSSVSSTAAFEPTNIGGITVVSKDPQGPATKLAVVAKAGTRYQPAPGLTAGLEGFAFKNTLKRSALRITRESELLGGQLTAYHTREAIVLEANFLREHLPYFTELLGEVISQTKFTNLPAPEAGQVRCRPARRGPGRRPRRRLRGEPLYPSATTPLGNYLHEDNIATFAETAYARPNFALVADGATQVALAKWVEPFFKGVPSAAGATSTPAASAYYGGQQRTASGAGNAVVVAFRGGGGQDVAKAVAKAKFDALTAQEPGSAAVTATAVLHGLAPFQPGAASKSFEAVTGDKLKALAKKLVEGKATYAAVGDLHVLPFAEDIGLTV